MKKRIIAIFLAFAVLVGVFSIPKRAHAAAAGAVAIVSIGVLAWEILDIMIKGEEPAIIVGIRTLIESGVDALTNPDSYFQQTYGDFWRDFGGSYDAVYNMALEMYENGELSISNGKVNLTYEQYKNFFDVSYSFVSNVGVEFNTNYNYFVFDYRLSEFLPVLSLPVNDMYYKSSSGQSYCLMYYNDKKAVFPNIYTKWRVDIQNNKEYYNLNSYFLSSSFNVTSANWYINNFTYDQMDYYNARFAYHSLNSFQGLFKQSESYPKTSNYCFVFENGNVSYQATSAVDVSDCKTAIVSSTGNFGDFLKSLISMKVYEPVSGTLDDLSTVLPVEDSPVLSIPINPDLSVPIPDQVTVSVPGANDLPLSDYMDPLITDIEAPTGLATKFPFCIPFDFIRIISVLAADPIPPVFRIPISTHPANLEGFADNETIGEFVSPDDPMFDINEEIVIDFAHIPLVQGVSYTIFLVGFVIMLIKLTPKLIQH